MALDDDYRQALNEDRLVFARCRACGRGWLPASRECPHCLAADWRWENASGRGTLISWCVYHMAYREELKARLPYAVAIVRLDEGPSLITNILGDPDALNIDMPVVVEVQAIDGVKAPVFRPAAVAAGVS